MTFLFKYNKLNIYKTLQRFTVLVCFTIDVLSMPLIMVKK